LKRSSSNSLDDILLDKDDRPPTPEAKKDDSKGFFETIKEGLGGGSGDTNG